MLRFFGALTMLLILPLNANAANINEEGAKKLKESFQKLLDYQKTVNEAFGGVRVVYDGELSVTQQTDFYTVTFPSISLKAPEFPDENGEMVSIDSGVFNVGVITLNAMPDEEKEHYWKVVMALPEKMALTSEGEEDFIVTFNDQNAIAMYNDTLGYFTKININMNGLNFKYANEDTGVSADSLQFYTNFDEKEDGKFSGPGYLSVNNLLIAPPEEEETIHLGELKFDFSMDDFVLPTLEQYEAKLMKHAETFKALGAPTSTEESTVTESDVMDMMFDLYSFDMSGMDYKYSAKDIQVVADPADEFREFDTLKLGSAYFGMGIKNLQTEEGELSVTVGYDDFTVTPEEEQLKDIMPKQGNIDLKANNIPYNTLLALFKNTMNSITQNPEAAQFAALGVLARLPAILTSAQTEIVLEKSGFDSPTYTVALDGKVKTDMAAMMGFAAKLDAVFGGMDALINIAKERSADENGKHTYALQEMIEPLEKLKSIGNPTTGPKGKPAYSFTIETQPAGTVTINGQDINEVMKPEPLVDDPSLVEPNTGETVE